MAGQYAHAEMTGIDEVLALLNGLHGDALMDPLRRGLARTMTRMRDDARQNCPIGEGDEDIHLRDTIDYTIEVKSNGVRGDLIASSEHAVFVEMGTGPVGAQSVSGADVSPQIRQRVTYSADGWIYPTGQTGPDGKPEFVYTEGMAPQPYLYPAYKRHEGKVLVDLKKAAEETIAAR